MPLSDDDIREILRIIDESDLEEIRVETDGFSLHVSKAGARGDATYSPTRGSTGGEEVAPPAQDALVTITAPMLGTFYRAEAPGKPPFVEVGTTVEPDTTVCIIEVMKMMNSIPAGVAGTIAHVLADNAELVEYGAPLFRVKPR